MNFKNTPSFMLASRLDRNSLTLRAIPTTRLGSEWDWISPCLDLNMFFSVPSLTPPPAPPHPLHPEQGLGRSALPRGFGRLRRPNGRGCLLCSKYCQWVRGAQKTRHARLQALRGTEYEVLGAPEHSIRGLRRFGAKDAKL